MATSTKYVVLRHRASGGAASDGFEMMSDPSAGLGVEVVVEDVPLSALGDVDRDPRTLAAAPEMPVALIEPTAGPDDGERGSLPAWGVGAVGALDSRYTGAGVSVAVLDTGIDWGHPAFAGIELDERDFTGTGEGDGHGHGTHCAGTILGRGDDPRIGVARGVTKLLSGKVLDSKGVGSAASVYQAMLWCAERGVNIVSLSLGFAPFKLATRLRQDGWPEAAAMSAALQSFAGNLRMFDALMGQFRAARGTGREILVVAASGNDSLRGTDPRFRVAASLPSAALDVVSVGSLRRTRSGLAVADSSNMQAIVSAPGCDVVSAWPGGGLRTKSGTSMACPHVVGVAALWWQALGPTATAEIVRAKLLAHSQTTSFAPGFDFTDVGFGMVRAP